MQHKTILGIDPGTKEMGLAVVRGPELIAYGVRTLRNGTRPYDVIGQARRIVLEMIARHEPDVVAIEKPLMLPTKRAAVLSVIAQELRARSEELGLRVVELSPEEVRQAVVGNPRATKIDVAERLVREFEQLRGAGAEAAGPIGAGAWVAGSGTGCTCSMRWGWPARVEWPSLPFRTNGHSCVHGLQSPLALGSSESARIPHIDNLTNIQ